MRRRKSAWRGGDVADANGPVSVALQKPTLPNIVRRSVDGVSANRRHLLGRVGERLAAEHYERLGCRVLARNHRTRRGELDLVVRDRQEIVFVEVKCARAGDMDPFEWITARKQRRIRELALEWLAQERPGHVRSLRFDAVGVRIDARGRLLSLEQREDVM